MQFYISCRTAILVSLVSTVLALNFGCAPLFKVAAAIDLERPPVPEEALLAVQVDPNAPSSLNQRIGRHIERGLKERGYELTSDRKAEYILVFDFGTREDRVKKSTTPGGGRHSVNTGPLPFSVDQELTGERSRRMIPDVLATPPDPIESYQAWQHYLRLTAIDATQLREDEVLRVAWAGVALFDETLTRDPKNPEELLDLFLTALLKHFPSATDGWVEVRISANDPRVRALRGED